MEGEGWSAMSPVNNDEKDKKDTGKLVAAGGLGALILLLMSGKVGAAPLDPEDPKLPDIDIGDLVVSLDALVDAMVMGLPSNWIESGNQTVGEVAAEPLDSYAENIQEVILQAHPDNADDILVGDVHAQEFRLLAGASMTIPVIDPTLIYLRSASGNNDVNWVIRARRDS